MTGAAINKALVRLVQQEVYQYTLGWWKTARVDPYPAQGGDAAVILTQKNVQGITGEAAFGLDPAAWPPPVVDYLTRLTSAVEQRAALALRVSSAELPQHQARPYNLQLVMAARAKYSLDMIAAGLPPNSPPSDPSAPAVYLSLAQVEEMTRVLFVSADPDRADASDRAQVEADTSTLEAQVDQV